MTSIITQLTDVLATTTTTSTSTLTGSTSEIIIRMVLSIVLGVCISIAYIICNKRTYSKNMAVSLVILPAMVSAIIWLIGSNITTAISLGGVFTLVRFRSVPGDSKDITNVLATMTAGLAIGLGYYEAAVIITVVAIVIYVVLTLVPFASRDEQQLNITIPENLNYNEIFDDVLKKYTSSYSLDVIKTSRMGTMFDLSYKVVIKNGADTKAMIDELRVKNGNLDIVLNRVPKELGPKVL
ncbi:MAG: DUF4956 domain-containing protein [Lachnospiraceae bacterium]|nr:DUF4956 domain-containing protein [Lachnospiraceae bacterium]